MLRHCHIVMHAPPSMPLSPTYRFGVCELRPDDRRLLKHGREVRIGGRGFDLLLALVEHRDRVVGNDELYERVWPGLAVEPNNLQVQVWALRKLLGRAAIATVARRGYRLMLKVQAVDSLVTLSKVQGSADSNAQGAVAHDLAASLSSQPWITLWGHDEPSVRRLAVESYRPVRQSMPGGIWHLEARDLAATPMASRVSTLVPLLQRLARQDAVLVLFDAHLAGDPVHDALSKALAASTFLRVLATAPAPLGLPFETAYRVPVSRDPAPTLASNLPQRGHPRWHARARDNRPR